MKKLVSILLLAGAGLWAQTAPPAPGSAPAFTPLPPRPAPAAAAPTNSPPPSSMDQMRRAAIAAQAAAAASNAAARLPAGPAITSSPDGSLVVAPSRSAAARTNAAPEEMLEKGLIDFRDADISQVLDIYSLLVNRTILRPANLPATPIKLRTVGDLTKREGIMALESVLQMNGIGVVPFGDKFVKVVPAPEVGTSGQKPLPWDLPTDELPELGSVVTRLVQLKYAKPSEMVTVLQPFTKLPGAIQPIESTQMILLRDSVENVRRMSEMIDAVDVAVPAAYTNEVIHIRYALASDIAGALNALGGGSGGGTMGGTANRTPSGSGVISGRSSLTRSGMGGYGGTGGIGGSSPFGGGMNPQAGIGSSAGAQPSSLTERLRAIVSPGTAGAGEIQVIGKTKILADERSNSLLVFATREDMATIKDIIGQLDVVLAQVMIKAVIMQVSLGDEKNLGVNMNQLRASRAGDFTGIGAINNGTVISSALISSLTNAGAGLSYVANFGNDLEVTVNALASDRKAKILQMPRVQTSNAKAATLFVGESRPYPQGSYYGGGSYGSYASFQQMLIGVSLNVTPLINVDGLVVMHIEMNIDSVSGKVNIANVGDVPITSSKQATSDVAVKDRDTIMLGGLIETDTSDTTSGVPFLKDIPLIGHLFKSSDRSKSRNELIVLIQPTVLPTPEAAAQHATYEQNNMPDIKKSEFESRREEEQRLRKVNREIQHQQDIGMPGE